MLLQDTRSPNSLSQFASTVKPCIAVLVFFVAHTSIKQDT